MSPLYKQLGAVEANLPYLWLAGPLTGLIVQPIIGALSDKTDTKIGRRTPYFLIGAVLASIGLFFMPFSSSLWMAASLLWILDTANNIAMEPYRAFVSDKLDKSQHPIGFLTQSAFTGLGQTLSYLTPTLLTFFISPNLIFRQNIPYTTLIAFIIGAVFSISSILWTIRTTKEYPLTGEEKEALRRLPKGWAHTFADIGVAIRDMPRTMKQLALVCLFQWYAMFCYWQYIASSISTSFFHTTDPSTQGYRSATLIAGQVGAFYNFIAFVAAFSMVRFTRRIGPKIAHSISLTLAGIGMLCIPLIHNEWILLLPMVGVGIAWGSIMGNPYIMLAGSLPSERTGVYMGIFNMFIVLPMMIQIFTLPHYYNSWLHGNPENVVRLAGALLLCAAVAVLFVKLDKSAIAAEGVIVPAGGH